MIMIKNIKVMINNNNNNIFYNENKSKQILK
jgi:hypothetical protein